jgi:hypothetical protein
VALARNHHCPQTARMGDQKCACRCHGAARSPQGEDHEAVESWRCTDCNCVNRDDEAFCFRCGAGQPEFPARVPPSRDGSVAVEDVVGALKVAAMDLDLAAASLLRFGHGVSAEATREAAENARRALAEFSPASTGDREDPNPGAGHGG